MVAFLPPGPRPGGGCRVVAGVPQRLDLPAAAGLAAAPVPGPAGQFGALGGCGPASRLAELHRGHGGRTLLADHPHGHRGQPAHGPGGGLCRVGGHLSGQRRRLVQPAGPCPARARPAGTGLAAGPCLVFSGIRLRAGGGFSLAAPGGRLGGLAPVDTGCRRDGRLSAGRPVGHGDPLPAALAPACLRVHRAAAGRPAAGLRCLAPAHHAAGGRSPR